MKIVNKDNLTTFYKELKNRFNFILIGNCPLTSQIIVYDKYSV